MGRLSLYFHTLQYMKPSQVYYRLKRSFGLTCSLGCKAGAMKTGQSAPIASLEELDFDPVFLARFSPDELLSDQVTFLHKSRTVDWKKWNYEEETALWNFNLHYFEFLFSLVAAYRSTGHTEYFEKSKKCIQCWIDNNQQGNGGAGWASYTIALRLTNWLSYISAVQTELEKDPVFFKALRKSMHEQYAYLAVHLEKDILGNHYFEDLKALLLCTLYFQDDQMYQKVLLAFLAECKEEILPDGMHFELSPMYHKIILEGVLRAAHALRVYGKPCRELEAYIQPMLNVAYSFEEGIERIPLFNDGGNNVAKSLDVLVQAAQRCFGIQPVEIHEMKDSGFYIFKNGPWKLVVDAGQPGPAYIPGHAHCDAMSYELFKDGKPVLMNCGTYAYQCKERSFFRSTAAHNTVMVEGVEQSQCWGAFRLAKRASVEVLYTDDYRINMRMTDQQGNIIFRTICLDGETLTVSDKTEGQFLVSYLHMKDDIQLICSNKQEQQTSWYAVDYGALGCISSVNIRSKEDLEYRIPLH